MLSFFTAFRESLVRQDLFVASLFNHQQLSVEFTVDTFKRFAMGLLLVTGISLILLLSTLFWEILYYLYCCICCCRKARKPVSKNRNLRIKLYVGLLGFMWFLMLGSAVMHYFAYVELKAGFKGTLGTIGDVLDALDSTFTHSGKNVETTNLYLHPFLALPTVVNISDSETGLDNKLNKLNSQITAAGANANPVLKRNALRYRDILVHGKTVLQITRDPTTKVDMDTLKAISQAFISERVNDENCFKKNASIFGKAELDTPSVLKMIQQYGDMVDQLLLPVILGEIGLVVLMFVISLILILTKKFRGLLAVWVLFINFVFLFLLLHIVFLNVSTAGGAVCHGFKMDNKNRENAKGLVEIAGVKWSLNNFKRFMLSCEKSGSMLTALYHAFDVEGDKPFDVADGNITLMYPNDTAVIKIKSDRLISINLKLENIFGIIAERFISEAYAKGTQAQNQFQAEPCKAMSSEVNRLSSLSPAEMELRRQITDGCRDSTTFSMFLDKPLSMTSTDRWSDVAKTSAAIFAKPGVELPFQCSSLANAVRATTNKACDSLLTGLDVFTGVHMVWGWVGFFILIYSMLLRSLKYTTKSKKDEMEELKAADPEAGEAEKKRGVRRRRRRRRLVADDDGVGDVILDEPPKFEAKANDLVNEVRSNIERHSYQADHKDPGLYSSMDNEEDPFAPLPQAPSYDDTNVPSYDIPPRQQYPADSKNPFLYDLQEDETAQERKGRESDESTEMSDLSRASTSQRPVDTYHESHQQGHGLGPVAPRGSANEDGHSESESMHENVQFVPVVGTLGQDETESQDEISFDEEQSRPLDEHQPEQVDESQTSEEFEQQQTNQESHEQQTDHQSHEQQTEQQFHEQQTENETEDSEPTAGHVDDDQVIIEEPKEAVEPEEVEEMEEPGEPAEPEESEQAREENQSLRESQPAIEEQPPYEQTETVKEEEEEEEPPYQPIEMESPTEDEPPAFSEEPPSTSDLPEYDPSKEQTRASDEKH